MSSICFYFQVHQPDRLRDYLFSEIKHSPFYLSEKKNREILQKVANKCYLPMAGLLKSIIKRTNGAFKFSLSFSGVFLEQCEQFAPNVLESFRELVQSPSVEVLSETYYHSLAFLYSVEEWKKQIIEHREKIQEIFGVSTKVFRNTELIYNNFIGEQISKLGYKGIIAEGVKEKLTWRSPNFLYSNPQAKNLKILLKNYSLSDDIAFRFSNKQWKEWPLTAEKYTDWIDVASLDGNLINLFMDFETFGEHQWEDSGIFAFMERLPFEVLGRKAHDFILPSEAIGRYSVVGEYDCPEYTSWADQERDLSAWKSNRLQNHAFEYLYSLESRIKRINKKELTRIWKRLTTSDHVYYMCTKYYADGDVHQYFSPYETPYEAYINFMNVVKDLEYRIQAEESKIINSKKNLLVYDESNLLKAN